MRYYETVRSPLSASNAVKKLADFEKVSQWDHSVKSCVARKETLSASREPCEGTTYDVVVDFLGSDVPIEYKIIHLSEKAVTLKGVGENSVTIDEMVCVDIPGIGCELQYNATISIAFPYWLVDCYLKCLFQQTVDEAIAGLRVFLSSEPYTNPMTPTN